MTTYRRPVRDVERVLRSAGIPTSLSTVFSAPPFLAARRRALPQVHVTRERKNPLDGVFDSGGIDVHVSPPPGSVAAAGLCEQVVETLRAAGLPAVRVGAIVRVSDAEPDLWSAEPEGRGRRAE